jgi:CRP-like cAMP-binding protein
MSQLKPKLGDAFSVHDLENGTFVIHHKKLGARFSVTQQESELIAQMQGEQTLDQLHESYRQSRGAFAFKDIQLLLFQLWSHGLLENGEDVRSELFSEHERPEFVKDSVRGKLSLLTSVRFMPKCINGESQPALARLGQGIATNRILWLGLLISLLPLPLLYYEKLQIPQVFFKHNGSWVQGIVLAYLSASFILTCRGLIRAAVAASIKGFSFKCGLQLRLGIVYLDMNDEHVDFLPAGTQIRFALAGLTAIGGVAGLCAVSQLIGGPVELSYFMVSAFILGIIDLCPLMPTGGERLIENLLHSNRPESVRRYIGTRMIRDLMVRHDEEFGSDSYPIIASLWIVWVGVALEVFQRFVLEDILALQTAIFTTEWLALKIIGGAFFAYVVLAMLAFAVGLAFVAVSLLVQVLSPDRITKPSSQKQIRDLGQTELNKLVQNIKTQVGATDEDHGFVDGVLERMQLESYQKGAWIQRAGRKDHRFFFVIEGAVDLLHCHKDGRHEFVATMSAGESFGDEGLTGHCSAHDAKAREDCRVGCLDGDILKALIEDLHDDRTSQILERAHFLDKVPELSGLGSAGRLRLAASAIDRDSSPGEVIIKQGEEPASMFIIKAGHCDVARQAGGQDKNIAQLGPGQTFGELGLLRGEPRNATVTASEALMYVEIPRQALESALAASFHVGLALEQLGNNRRPKEQ